MIDAITEGLTHNVIMIPASTRNPKHVIIAKTYIIFMKKCNFSARDIQSRQIACKIGRLHMESENYMFQILNAFNN